MQSSCSIDYDRIILEPGYNVNRGIYINTTLFCKYLVMAHCIAGNLYIYIYIEYESLFIYGCNKDLQKFSQ